VLVFLQYIVSYTKFLIAKYDISVCLFIVLLLYFHAVVHTILLDLSSPSKYFRFNPILSEPIAMDENRDEKLHLLTTETNAFIRSQEEKLTCAVAKLVECKSKLKACQQWVSLYLDSFTGI